VQVFGVLEGRGPRLVMLCPQRPRSVSAARPTDPSRSTRRAYAALNSLALGSNPIEDKAMIQLLEVLKDVSLTHFDISETECGTSTASKLAELLAEETKFKAAIEKVTVSGCKVTQETAAQLLAAANEASRVRLRTHQLLAFSKAFHERLGSECLLQAVRSMQIYGGESLRMFVSDMGTSSCVRS
jgi:hypothetical protein